MFRIVPIVRVQVALDNVPLRIKLAPSSQKFSEEPMFIFFLKQVSRLIIIHPNKMIGHFTVNKRIWKVLICPQSGYSFKIATTVLENQWLSIT